MCYVYLLSRTNATLSHKNFNFNSSDCVNIRRKVRFSVACFGVKVSVTFHLMFVNIISSLVWVYRPPFGKELLTRLAICSHCVLTIFLF